MQILVLHLKITPFTKYITHINGKHIDTAKNIDFAMPMYNLIECTDNYSDTLGSLWQFKRDELAATNVGNPDNVITDNSGSFKYKSSILGKAAAGVANGKLTVTKIVVSLNYLSNF